MGSSVILMLCNPMTRVLSDYGHHLRKIKQAPYPTIEDMLLDDQGNINVNSSILIPSKMVSFKYITINVKHFLMFTGLYSDQIPSYLAYFPLGEKLHIVDGDNFAVHPWEEVALVEHFLSLSPILANASLFHLNTKEGKEKLYCWDVPQKANKEKCIEAARGIKHVELSEEVEDKLRNFLKPYNDKLFEMLGRTFDWSDYH